MDALQAFEAAAKAARNVGRGAYFYAAAFRGAWTEPFTTAQAAREEAARKALEDKEAEEDVAEPVGGAFVFGYNEALPLPNVCGNTPNCDRCARCGCKLGEVAAVSDLAPGMFCSLRCQKAAEILQVILDNPPPEPAADAAPLDPSSSIPAWQPADGEGGEVDSGIHPPPTSPHPNLLAGDVPRPSPAGTTTGEFAAAVVRDVLRHHDVLTNVPYVVCHEASCHRIFTDLQAWREHVAAIVRERIDAADERVTDRLDGVSPQFHHWFDAAATFPQYQKRTEK